MENDFILLPYGPEMDKNKCIASLMALFDGCTYLSDDFHNGFEYHLGTDLTFRNKIFSYQKAWEEIGVQRGNSSINQNQNRGAKFNKNK